MLVPAFLLILGFAALIFGADKLVDSASSLASRMGISNMVIGLTVVAFGTSAPELVVNVFASVSGETEMVLGNVLGSNIFNVLGILGISALIYPLTVKTNTTWIEIPLSLLAAVCVYVVAADIFMDGTGRNLISRSDGVILLLFFIIFLAYNLSISKNEAGEEEVSVENYSTGKAVFFLILGLACLVLGGRLIVTSAVEIAESLGLSQRVIGLTIVSIGTSLPELATSIVAVRKRNVDIAVGNVVGSNIFNIFFILGLSTVITPLEIPDTSFVDIFLNILTALLLFAFIFTGKGRKLERWEGVVFLIAYMAYLVYLINL